MNQKKEPFEYRARKWALQKSTTGKRSQIRDLDAIDWEVLVVLDACRFDTLRSVTSLPESTRSPASATPTWIERMAGENFFDDAHVVTANPQYEQSDIDFDSIDYVYQDHWDRKLLTQPPGPVLERACHCIDQLGKPVIVHLVQPHWPYIIYAGERWIPAMDFSGIGTDLESESAQVAMASGKINPEKAHRAYRACVESIWQFIQPYVADWVYGGNRVVITSDHGESFGRLRDWGMYEHPSEVHIRSLTEVPLVDLPAVPDSAASHQNGDMRDKLEALGYVA